MVNDILIRNAAPEELDEIEALVKAAYLEFRPLFPEKVWQAWMDNISKVIHSETGLLLVLENQGKIEGVVKFFPDASQSGMGHWPEGVAAIRVFAVWPQGRGRG